MAQCRFSTPVLAHLPFAKCEPYGKALDGPHEALHAVLRGELSESQFDSVELTWTVRKLARATREPTLEFLEEARSALAALIKASPEPPPRWPASAH
jgi:hypothetical protein